MTLAQFKKVITIATFTVVFILLTAYATWFLIRYCETKDAQRNLEYSNLSLSIEHKKLEIEKIKYELKMYGDIDKDINK